ncbi:MULTISPECIES: hypothetical protein [unclassified Microbacterium]|uniref:hypothetical protein n=1 Tax=unclassified Microbacterium TaxID=2609290 RepID=UPI0030194987
MSQVDRTGWHIEEAGLTRAERRAVRRQLRQQSGTIQTEERATKANLPPATGPVFGNGMLERGWWNLFPITVPAHNASTRDLSGIYPFVADAGIGMKGPILGVDMNADSLFCYSPWESYNDDSDRGAQSTNILVLGAYRGGKSGTIKLLVMRGLAWGYQAVVPSDPKAEWVPLARATEGGLVIVLGDGSRLNPLDRGPRRAEDQDEEDREMVKLRRSTVLTQLLEIALGRSLTPAESAAANHALQLSIGATNDNPTLRNVHVQLTRMIAGEVPVDPKPREAAEDVRLTLDRFITGELSGMFEDDSTVQFDEDAPIVVVDTSRLFQRSDLVAQVAQLCTSSWVQAAVSDGGAHRRRFLVREEGWRDMQSEEALKMYQQWLKLSRKYGISNIVILHTMRDLDAVGPDGSKERALAYAFVQDIENKFLFHVNAQEADNLRARLSLPAPHVAVARRLRKGEFLAYVGGYAYVVDCFATSTPAEYELTKTDDALISDRAVPDPRPALPGLTLDDLWPAQPTTEQDWDLDRVWAAPATETSADEWIESWEG